LLPFSWIWRFVSSLRHLLYDNGVFRTIKVGVPVISVGNLAVGGTGKTPLVIQLAHQLAPRVVAIVLRGYGGDEELLFKKRLPNALVIANPDRVKAAREATAQGAEVILLDDGFQHRKLGRDVNLVIVRDVDAKRHCLPAGDLRDPLSRLRATDLIIREADLQTHVRRILTLQGEEVPSLRGKRVGMFCGIGQPDKFKKTLLDLGAIIDAEWILADHEPASIPSLHAFNHKCKSLNINLLVCTEKDAVKLPPSDLPILFLEIEVQVAGLEKLMAKIEERMYNSPD